MLYFIHSPKQSDYNGIDMYWKANEVPLNESSMVSQERFRESKSRYENGYTSILANAGVYTEEDKERIESRSSEYGATFVPITKELLQQAKIQLQEKIAEYDERIEQENARHIAELERLNEMKSQYSALGDLSHITVRMEEIEIEGEER